MPNIQRKKFFTIEDLHWYTLEDLIRILKEPFNSFTLDVGVYHFLQTNKFGEVILHFSPVSPLIGLN